MLSGVFFVTNYPIHTYIHSFWCPTDMMDESMTDMCVKPNSISKRKRWDVSVIGFPTKICI